VIAAAALAIAAGLVFGYPLVWLVGVLGAYLAWNLYELFRLERWLTYRRGGRPRSAAGVWGNVLLGLNRLQKRNRDRKRRLNRVLKEFRKATGAIPDASVVLNADGEIAWLNAMATEYLGIAKADRGSRIENLLRDPDFIAYLRDGDFDHPIAMTSPVDGERDLSVQIIAYGDRQRLLLAKDVTQQRRLEKVRRDFVGNASHELRSPLTVITGYLDSMTSDPELAEGWREPVSEMSAQAARMRSIIDDLLTLSRLEASGAPAGDERVDVPGLASLIRKDALASRSSCAEIEVQFETSACLLGSESELYSAFWNLVQNAVKYTGQDGRIVIRWSKDDAGGHFSVSDTGVGIPSEAIPRLTERFYRVDKGRDRAKGGTGLGLAIVKHILQRHEARLEVTSELGVGSVFTCHFPATRIDD
jgi:two-component system phosphate regulon sensor histidine kinase PhoR